MMVSGRILSVGGSSSGLSVKICQNFKTKATKCELIKSILQITKFLHFSCRLGLGKGCRGNAAILSLYRENVSEGLQVNKYIKS